MNIIQIFQKFPNQESCIEFLEKARWGDNPKCPYCESKKVSKHASKDRNISRWQCQQCTKAFSVTVGTIFHKTKLPLQKWFLAIALVLNAKKGISNRQLGRDLGLPCNTAWSIAHKIRNSFMNNHKELLQGIIEMDETYIGGKSKGIHKRGRGTDKMAVLGIVERQGNAFIQKAQGKINFKNIASFVKSYIDTDNASLLTDEYRGYNGVCAILPHATINHSKEYVNGNIHTNTIENIWSLVKRAWYGQHHHYSENYADLYLSEVAYKYNNRNNPNVFVDTIKRLLCV